jgi:hypothetical protein
MGLLALIREHGDAIEADLAFRGFDLLDMWRGTLSPRRVDVLVRGLPPDSATRMAMNDREPLWSRTDYILADVFDAVQGTNWIIANKDVEKEHNRSKHPTPYPRPGGAAQSTKKEITAADLAAFRERTKRG